MTVISFTLTFIINIMNALKGKKNKIFLLLFIITLSVLMGGNTSNPDYYSYEVYYYNYGSVVAPDIGFRIINSIFNKIGVSYEIFRLIISVVSFYILNLSIKKCSNNPAFVYLLFSIFPFVLDVVQIRNFLMTSIVLYAMTHLIDRSYKKSLKYIVLVLIAASIHLSALIYLPIVFMVNFNRSFFFRIALIYAIILGVLIGLNKNILEAISSPLFQYLSQYDSRFQIYSSINTRYGYLLYWFIQFSNILMIKWSKKIVSLNRTLDTNKKKIVDFAYFVNVYMLLLLPFYVFEITYFRYARNIMVLNYIAYSVTYLSIKKNKHKKIMYILSILICVSLYFYIGIYRPHLINIIEPIFKSNWILK